MLAPTWQDLPRARLGPILLFSLTAGVLFHVHAPGAGGSWPAAAAARGLGLPAQPLRPRPLRDLRRRADLALGPGDRRRSPRAIPEPAGSVATIGRWLAVLGFGLAVGCALATKLTGWFLPLPFLVWAAWVRDRRALRVLAVGLPLAGAVLFLLNPPWWTEPIAGLSRFFRSNLTRGQTIPIPVQFLGTVYQTPNESLPWYNTLVWTVMVTPVGFLLLAMRWDRPGGPTREDASRSGLLILAHWVLLMALRALPHTPGHDGVRLFLPAFGVLALLVGLGARSVLERFGRLVTDRRAAGRDRGRRRASR